MNAFLLAFFFAAPPTLRIPEGVKPLTYKAELTLDPTADSFHGVIDIELEVAQPTSTIWLNGNDLKIEKSSADAVLPGGKHFVGFEHKKPLAKGTHKLHIEYTAPLQAKDSVGASKQKEGDDWYIFTQFEPIDARRVFPCFDEPFYKVPWQLTLKVRKSDRAFTNTAQIDEKTEGDWKRITFAPSKPLPTYLVAFGVGPFEIVDGGMAKASATPVRIITPKGQAERARFAAESSVQALDRLEAYFGSSYPYGKLDFIAVPLFGGAMEHPGLITFSSNLILQKPADETVARKRAYAEVAVHELAHQWFGNLVTMAWWDDIWLNEAFATWITPKIMEQWKPTWGFAEDRVNTRSEAMHEDSLVTARCIRQPIVTIDDIKNAFDGITYQKGATVIATFERLIGPDVFQRGVQRHMAAHAHKNATAKQFFEAISTEAKRDIAPPFSTFLDQPGVPLVSFDLQCGVTATLKLRQQRYLPLGSTGTGDGQVWSIPVCVRTDTAQQCVLMTAQELDVELGKTCPKLVVTNDGGTAYYRSLPSADLLAKLTAALPTLSAPERLSIVSDINALVKNGKLDLGTMLALAPKLKDDKNRDVVTAVAGTVGSLREASLITAAQDAAYTKYINDTFGARAKKLGWAEKPSDDEDTKLLRSNLVPLVARAGKDKALIAEAQKLAAAWLKDRKAVSPNMVQGVLTTAAQNGDQKLFDSWLTAAKAEKDRAERTRLLNALASFRDPAIVKASLPVMLSDAFEIRESDTLMWAPANHPATRQVVWDWLTQNYDAVTAKLPRDYGAYLPWLTVSACDAATATQMKTFFADRATKVEGGPRQLDQALEEISLCAAYREKQAPAVAKFFAK